MYYDLLFTMADGVYTWMRFHTKAERADFIRRHPSWNLKTFDKRG